VVRPRGDLPSAGGSAARRRPGDRPWRTLRGRVAIGALVGLLVASAAFGLVSVSLVRSGTEQSAGAEFDRQVRAVAQLVSNQTETITERGECVQAFSRENLERFVGPGTRLYVQGLPACPGGPKPFGDLPEAASVEIDRGVLARDGLQRISPEPFGGSDFIAAAAPITIRQQPIAELIVVKPREEVFSTLEDVAPRLALATAIAFVPALLLTLLLTRRITRPIERMRAATDRVAAGDLSTEVGRHGVTDLDALADDFNVMVERLREREDASRDFLMKITHDLRTPLTAIRGHAAALSDGVVPEEMRPRSLGAIESEAGRLESMVTDLLDLARIQADRFRVSPSVTDPAEALESAVDAHSADAAARGVRLEARIAAVEPIVTDAARLRQIVDNLLDNALRWSPDGGTVGIEAVARRGGGVAVTVSDAGPGVPEEMREAIFEPFRSEETPDGRTGTGLGLAICRQLARALGGDVVAGEASGGGARFTLTLPASPPGQTGAAVRRTAADPVR
jgi:two-component system, OmpR family, sensor kinase